MAQLGIRTMIPLGNPWNWVKGSFSIFRDKPINFIFLAAAFAVFSFFPFIGSFISILVLVRIYVCADKTYRGESFGLGLNFGEILHQRNVISYALLSMFFDLLVMLLIQEIMRVWGIDLANHVNVNDRRLFNLLILAAGFRIIFFGISLAIITFNPTVKLFEALLLNWKFMLKHLFLIVLAAFLLAPLLFIPLYLGILIAFTIENDALLIIGLIIIILTILTSIAVTTIFGYKVYLDSITHD